MLRSASAASPSTSADAPSHERDGATPHPNTPAPSRSGRISASARKRMIGRLCANATGSGYVPLDELLATPKVRVLRFLRRRDSASSHEMHEGLEIQDDQIGAYNQVISRLHRDGLTSRTGKAIGSYRYSITALGRERLARMLARSEVTPYAPRDERDWDRDELEGAA